jgi:hypothetical protein
LRADAGEALQDEELAFAFSFRAVTGSRNAALNDAPALARGVEHESRGFLGMYRPQDGDSNHDRERNQGTLQGFTANACLLPVSLSAFKDHDSRRPDLTQSQTLGEQPAVDERLAEINSGLPLEEKPLVEQIVADR